MANVQVFMIIFILITSACGYLTEVEKCWGQIKNAFGHCKDAHECLRYAIQFYVYDENILNSNENNECNAGQSSGQGDSNAQFYDEQLFAELGDFYNYDPGYNNQMITNQEGFYNYDPGYNNQMFTNQEDPNSNAQSSNYQPSEPIDERTQLLRNAEQFHYKLPTIMGETDYATLYHTELYNSIVGKGVLKREDYCFDVYDQRLALRNECKDDLVFFQGTAVAAVRWAFTRHTIDECLYLKEHLQDYKNITEYMIHIIQHAQTNPSRKPSVFCRKVVHEMEENQRNNP